MNCPHCKGYQLEPNELEPGLVAGKCLKCQGALVSLMNYRFWADQQDSFKASSEVSNIQIPDVVETEDNNKAQVCPKCAKLMTKFQIGLDSRNRLELCTGCDEVWLDSGEWTLIKQMDLADKLPKIFTDVWQRNIRLERQEKIHKNRYERLLGETDFAKLDTFKQWLDKHPEKSQIKQYLITNLDSK
jgi:Zn-finger nucleic acid-binding protein